MGLLEVIALDGADAQAAAAGGANRVELVGTMSDDGLSPHPRTVEQVCRLDTIRVRPMVRLRPGFGTDAVETIRLKRLIASFVDAGADGVVLGYLDATGAVDEAVVADLVTDGAFAWTFHRAMDHSRDRQRAWQAVKQLPRVDQVLTAGSADGVGAGIGELVSRANSDRDVARLTMVGGGLAPHHVLTIARAGIRAFHIGSSARPGGSFSNPVSPDLVARWRELVEAATLEDR